MLLLHHYYIIAPLNNTNTPTQFTPDKENKMRQCIRALHVANDFTR
jgi:hypothetical protein